MNIVKILSLSLGFLAMLLITCIQTYLYYKTIGISQKFKGSQLILVMLVFSVIEALLLLFYASYSLVMTLISILIFILYPVIFMSGKLKERIFFGVVSISILYVSYMLRIIIVYPQRPDMPRELWQPVMLGFVLAITIYGILVLLVIHMSNEGKRYIPHKYWTYIIICFSTIFVGLLFGCYWLNRYEKTSNYLVMFSLGSLFVWLLSYFIFYFVCRYFSKATEAATLSIQNDMIERYMLCKQASDERIKILSHDLKHSLMQWRAFAEERCDTNALKSIVEYEGQLLSTIMINVENENANAILNQKYWEASQAQIEFLIDGAFHKDMIISNLDLCSLLGNLLDNAIEAAIQAETECLRRIKLSIRRKGNLLILMMENGYAIAPVIENGMFITQKKDKDSHAIGMLSIRYVAEKYDGVVKNSFESNWFKATIMLKGYENALSNK